MDPLIFHFCSELRHELRSYFREHHFDEAVTEARIPAPAPEETIEAITSEERFLRTSPELALKNLLSLGVERLYEIGPCFRAEEFGRRHRSEFTMLEYYAAGWNYRELAEFTAAMIAHAAQQLADLPGRIPDGFDYTKHEYITVNEAFQRYAGVDAFTADRDGSFDELMVLKVEPELGRGQFTFLCDYPASRASLSRLSPADPRVAERWELYARGLELGNAFGELTDAKIQRERFAAARKIRAAAGMHDYPEPTEFYGALDRGLPFSSGCAIGLDRLAMALLNLSDIALVRF